MKKQTKCLSINKKDNYDKKAAINTERVQRHFK